MIQGTLNKMELFKPIRFNADKHINVLMGTRCAATCRIVFWAVIFWLDQIKIQQEFPECCRGPLGFWTRAQEHSKVN